MVDGLTIKTAKSLLGYKRSKAITYIMEALYVNDRFFYNRLKGLENTTAVLAKATVNVLQSWGLEEMAVMNIWVSLKRPFRIL